MGPAEQLCRPAPSGSDFVERGEAVLFDLSNKLLARRNVRRIKISSLNFSSLGCSALGLVVSRGLLRGVLGLCV